MITHSSFVNALKQVLEVCGINSSEYSGHLCGINSSEYSGHLCGINSSEYSGHLCGINSSEYSGHSFRRGGASHAFKCNIPAALINLQGDWKSNAYLRYIDIPLDVRWNMMNVFSDNM